MRTVTCGRPKAPLTRDEAAYYDITARHPVVALHRGKVRPTVRALVDEPAAPYPPDVTARLILTLRREGVIR